MAKKRNISPYRTIFYVGSCIFLVATLLITFWLRHHILSPSQKQTTPVQLSEKEYKSLQKKLTQLVIDKSVRDAIEYLSLEMEKPEVSNSCHGLVHEIGHMAYIKYGDFAKAVSYQDDICGSGYLHGVIEQHFRRTTDILTTLQTICGNIETTIDGKCLHGVGHGLMYYTNNDLPKSLALCTSYLLDSAKVYCSEGVFMENFSSLQEFHPTSYLTPDNPFYPCPTVSSLFKDGCYFYAPEYFLSLHPREYVQALRWCESAETPFAIRCINGVGSRTMKQNINNPALSESVCLRGKNQGEVIACIDGMVSYHLVNFNSIKQTEKMCYSLIKQNQKICLSSLTQRKGLFSE